MALSIEQAKALVIEFCAEYPVASKIAYKIRNTQEEALDEPRATVEREGRIYGAYFPGRGYAAFAVSNFRDEDDFKRTLRHEILGHFGINTFKPEEKRAILNRLIDSRNEPLISQIWAEVDRAYVHASELRKAEEVFAFACETIEPHVRVDVSAGVQSFEDTCLNRRRLITLDDLDNITTMVAEGLHDRTRSQQIFPDSDSAQFKQDTRMKTSDYPVWLAVLPDDRGNMRAAAGQLSDGRAAVEWNNEEKLWFARPGADLERLREWLPDRSVRAGGGDPESEFLDVLTQAGLIVKGMPIMDGTRQRVSTTDDKHGKQSGVYCGFLNRRPAGWFINYHRADSAKEVMTWTSTGGDPDPVARVHIRAAAKQSQEDSARERALNYARQTRIATKLYDRLPAADPAHPYLVRKGIPPTPDLRQTRNGALVVPFFNAQGTFKTLQYIRASGDKRLFKGAPKQGHFLVVGGPLEPGQPILYAEGYATARSLNLATDRPVVMTIDAGNMVAVAQILHQRFPGSQHLFMADFDHAKDVNKGVLMANEAAAQVGGQVLYPAFTPDEIAQGFTDFNDLHHSRGLDAVREQTAPLFVPLDEVFTMPDQPSLDFTDSPSLTPESEPRVTPADITVPPENLPATTASDTVVQNTSTLESPPVAGDPLPDAGPQPLSFTYNGQPASLNLQDYQPSQLPEALLPAGPAAAEPGPERARSEDVLAAGPVPALDESIEPPVALVLNGQADVADIAAPDTDEKPEKPEKPQTQAEPVLAPAEALQATSAESAPLAQLAEALPGAKDLTADHLQWARSQPWFDGAGQDDDGAYVYARELSGKQVQWMFRHAEELMTWAEQQRALNVQAAASLAPRAPVAVDPAQPDASADAIVVGPRIGQDEPPLQPSLIDKDALLTRITHEPQADNSVLYKLDNQPAFVDRGARLEMVPGAGQSDEKIMAALLTAARFYRGQIELTGSDAFKAKAIELIAQHQVNVSMKNPAQQLMLDQARQALTVPTVKPDAILGETPPPYDPAPPMAPVQPPSVASAPEPQQAAVATPLVQDTPASSTVSAASVAVNADAPPSAPSQAPDLESPSPVKTPAKSVDDVPAKGMAEKVDPSVHQPPEKAKEGITGKVLACGKAPFRFDPENNESVYIKLRTKTGVQTFWGMELAGLLRESRIEPGRMVTLQFLGQQPVIIQVPIKVEGKVTGYEDKQAHRNQWTLSVLNGPTVRTGDDQGVKLAAYDAHRFAMIHHSVVAQLKVPVNTPALPAEGLFWVMPNGQGSARAGDELSASRPAVDSQQAGQRVMSSWSPDGQLDMALFRADGPYLQGVVRQGPVYVPVLVSLPGHAEAAPMVFNQVTEQGLVPIGVGNGINHSGGEPVAREHIAFKLEGDAMTRIAKLDFPAEVPPMLHHRLGFDERWKDTSALPKSAPAPAPSTKPSAMRPT